ncbi:type VI secretion protein IcmF [Candidatus Magnetomorum sp. HK-1]|nr:type VI secretion protein IcmF [Candidatus Magnetomorum sp. HK-1]
MSFQPKKLMSEIFSSSASRIFGGALCGGLIVGIFMKIARNFDFSFHNSLIWILWIVVVFIVVITAYNIWRIWCVDNIIEKKKNDERDTSEISSDTRSEIWEKLKTKKRETKRMVSIAKKEMKQYFRQEQKKFSETKRRKYDLPYVIHLGKMDSGKTKLIRNSNLFFSIKGNTYPGGTPYCDMWGPDGAVLLDTPGRYAISANPDIDKQEFKLFLKELVKYRPRRPIDGVIVAISAESLMDDSISEMKENAKSIREALHAAISTTSIVFPVYIMITMMDRILGFSEFVKSLDDKNDHQQIFGWNRPNIDISPFNFNEYSNFFDAQSQRLDMWVLRRTKTLSSNIDSDNIYRICAFPAAFRQLKMLLSCYLEIIFKHDSHQNHDRKDHPLIFRGCYFSSSMQKGKAYYRYVFDDIERSDSQKYQEEISQQNTQSSRSYFVDQFYKNVFMEKNLVTQTKPTVLRELKYFSAAVVVAVIAFLIIAFTLKPFYQQLKYSVKPINEIVFDVRGMLFEDETMPLSTTISYINSIENSRGGISLSKNKQIMQDLKIIEDALIIKGVFRPLIEETGKAFADISLTNTEQKRIFIKALKQYILIISGKSLSQISIGPILNFLSMSRKLQGNISHKNINYLIKTYPRGNYVIDILDAPPIKEIIQTKHGLLSLHSFWKACTNDKWQKNWLNLKHVADSYLKLFEKIDKKNVKKFKHYSELLINKEHKIFLDPPENLKKICIDDYDSLLEGCSTENTVRVKNTIDRHKSVCSSLKVKMDGGWENSQKSYRYLLKPDGTVNPNLVTLIDALSATVEFGQLFLKQHKRLLKRDKEMSGLISGWYDEWNKEKDILKSRISFKVSSLIDKGWRKEELIIHLNSYLDNVVRHEMKAAIKYGMNITFSNFEKFWRRKIGHQFPFNDAKIASVSNYNSLVRTVNISTASMSSLHDFFYSPKNGFEKFSENLESLTNLTFSPELSKKQKKFITRCLDWKKFLYDKSGLPNEHQLIISLLSKNSGKSLFTKMLIQGMSESNETTSSVLRFSGNHKQTFLKWDLALNPEFLFKAMNEGTQKSSILNIKGNNLLLPGYLYQFGQKSLGGIRWDFIVSFPFFSEKGHRKLIDVNLRLEWDQTIPPIIHWSQI